MTTPYYQREGVTVYCGDCLEVMADLEDNTIPTIITDPPYGLAFMGKDWDRGVPGVRYWKEALRVAKPGAMLLAFGGTRTHHRLMCAIEDAGWEIRDVLNWLYGSGFPKSHDISKAIDKAAGATREVVGPNRYAGRRTEGSGPDNGDACYGQYAIPGNETAPSTPLAQTWDGWGTALKPAWEPIIVAMAPLDGTFAQNAEKWGVAGLWIDGGRIPTDEDTGRLNHTGPQAPQCLCSIRGQPRGADIFARRHRRRIPLFLLSQSVQGREEC
jgi:site-specific DNA-methyltransferase (adenine-specific)